MYKLSPYMEGIIGDAMKTALDVDVDEIKDKWEDIDRNNNGNIMDKAEVLNDDGIQKAKNSIDDINSKLSSQKVDTRSIIARARKSILQFPIYISSSIRINEAHIISKLFERVYATLVQTVIAQNQILSPEEAKDLLFLQKFHTNLREAADLFVNEYYTPIDEIDTMLKESAYNEIRISPTMTAYFCVSTPDERINYESARQMNEPLTGFYYLREANDNTETTDSSETTTSMKRMTEDDWRDTAIDELISSNGLSNDEKKVCRMKDGSKLSGQLGQSYRAAQKKIEDKVSEMKKDVKDAGEDGKYGIVAQGGQYTRTETISHKSIRAQKHGPLEAPKLLKDSEIKKVNGMLPYTIECVFRIQDNRGALSDEVRFIIGIKSVLHLIDPADVAEDLRDLTHGELKSLRKVRYKTGEMNFWEYLFDVKGIKKDALKTLNGNKKWMTTLKRLREFKKTNGSLLQTPASWIRGKKGVPIPNGTIIFTQTDVDYMKNETGIDISKVGEAKRLCGSLYLIGIAIVDSAAGTMKVMFPDSDNDWDHQSLAQIDAELAKTDNSKLMNELNRMVNRV